MKKHNGYAGDALLGLAGAVLTLAGLAVMGFVLVVVPLISIWLGDILMSIFIVLIPYALLGVIYLSVGILALCYLSRIGKGVALVAVSSIAIVFNLIVTFMIIVITATNGFIFGDLGAFLILLMLSLVLLGCSVLLVTIPLKRMRMRKIARKAR